MLAQAQVAADEPAPGVKDSHSRAMTFPSTRGAPPRRPRRPPRSSGQRRAQEGRAQARCIQRVLGAFAELSHRGCRPSRLGSALAAALRANDAPCGMYEESDDWPPEAAEHGMDLGWSDEASEHSMDIEWWQCPLCQFWHEHGSPPCPWCNQCDPDSAAAVAVGSGVASASGSAAFWTGGEHCRGGARRHARGTPYRR